MVLAGTPVCVIVSVPTLAFVLVFSSKKMVNVPLPEPLVREVVSQDG